MRNDTDHVIVELRTENEIVPGSSEDDLLYLSGNVEVLVGDVLLVVGQFKGSILLLPSIDVLADATRKLRAGHRTVEILLVGDSSSIWLNERKRAQRVGVSLTYRGIETELVTRAELDRSLEHGVVLFLESLIAARSVRSWPHEPHRILDNVISTWPDLARLKRNSH